jgi:hypothetical protein
LTLRNPKTGTKIMAEPPNLDKLADEIRNIYTSDRLQAENLIEQFLQNTLGDISNDDKLEMIDKLTRKFKVDGTFTLENLNLDQEVLSRIFSLLLGRNVSQAELSSDELLQRLADSLKTIFDMLNQLVSVINRTFLGQREGAETIRQMIGFHLEGDDHTRSLEGYLGQINKAFLTAQQAFKHAAEKKMKEILVELEPDRITASARGGLKFGRLRKAEYFELYTEKFNAFKKWVDSGRYIEELLREFENNCQKIFLQQGGG